MTKSVKVLVIDDIHGDVTVITRALQHSKLDYLVVKESSDAVEAARNYQPDVILLDLDTPKTSGYQVLEAIRKDPETKGIEVVQIAASDNLKDLLVSVRVQVADYIVKPIKISLLLERIRTIAMCRKMSELTSEFQHNAQKLASKYSSCTH